MKASNDSLNMAYDNEEIKPLQMNLYTPGSDLAGRVQPPLTDRELVDMFLGDPIRAVLQLSHW